MTVTDLEPYTGELAPPEEVCHLVQPRLLASTARVWRQDRGQARALLQLDARVDLPSMDDVPLARMLQPFEAALKEFPIYLEHGAEARLPRSWAIGTLDASRERAFALLYEFLAIPAGPLMLGFLREAGAAVDLTLRIAAYSLEPQRAVFAITDYDLGIHDRFAR